MEELLECVANDIMYLEEDIEDLEKSINEGARPVNIDLNTIDELAPRLLTCVNKIKKMLEE